MAQLIQLEANKTYATIENAVKAVEKKFPKAKEDGLHYFINRTEDGRFFPVFIGQKATLSGVHFHFNVVA